VVHVRRVVPIFLDDLLEDVLHAQHQVVDAAPVLRPVELEPGPLLLDDLRGVATNFPPPNLDGFRARSGWGVVILHG